MEKRTAIPAIITGHPFANPNGTIEQDEPHDSDFESHEDEPILTPTSSRFPEDAHEEDDLPPSYAEVQAQRTATFPTYNDLEVRRVVLNEPPEHSNASTAPSTVIYTPPASVVGTPGVAGRQSSFPRPTDTKDRETDGHANAMLNQLLAFTNTHPAVDGRYAAQLTRRIAIPPLFDSTTGFPQVYSNVLHTRSVTTLELSAFVQGLNALLASAPTPQIAQMALLHLADPVTYEGSPGTGLVQQYIQRVNSTYFAPRGLHVGFKTLPSLLYLLPLPDRNERRLIHQLRRSISKIDNVEAASKALDPYVEPLTWPSSPASPVGSSNTIHQLSRANLEQVSGTIGGTSNTQSTGIHRSPGSAVTLPSYHSMAPPPMAPRRPTDPPTPGVLQHTSSAPAGYVGAGTPYTPTTPTSPLGLGRVQTLQQHAELIGKHAEYWGGQVEKWSDQLGKRAGKLGENLGKHIEKKVANTIGFIPAAAPQGARSHGSNAGAYASHPTGQAAVHPVHHPYGISAHGPHAVIANHIAARAGAIAQGGILGGRGARAARREARRDRRHDRREARHDKRHRSPSPSDSSSDDSDESDSDDGHSSAEEAEAERFDAEAEFIARIASIERKATADMASLGEKAKAVDVQKVETRKKVEINKVQTEKLHADLKYAAKTFKSERKRAHRSLMRDIRHERREWKKALHEEPDREKARRDMRDLRENFKQRKQVSKEMYKDAVKNYRDTVKQSRDEFHEGIGLRQKERRAGWASRKGAWMVWLVIEDIEHA